jgi:hypothetical protein
MYCFMCSEDAVRVHASIAPCHQVQKYVADFPGSVHFLFWAHAHGPVFFVVYIYVVGMGIWECLSYQSCPHHIRVFSTNFWNTLNRSLAE